MNTIKAVHESSSFRVEFMQLNNQPINLAMISPPRLLVPVRLKRYLRKKEASATRCAVEKREWANVP